MRHLKESNPQRSKVRWWLPGPGKEKGKLLFNEYGGEFLQDEESSGDEWWRQLHNFMNVFKTTELYTEKRLR